MEDKKTQPSLSLSGFEGLPSLSIDEKKPKTSLRKRSRPLKLKALSMPVGTKNKEELNALRYNISDHYNLMEKLGFGTYSQVRRGIHKKSEEIYAVKISKGQTSGNFLKNEAEILKQLNSDFIPKFHEFQTDSFSNKSYLVMEYRGNIILNQIKLNIIIIN